ncbi:hypothetical protein DACRYDRAFT_16343 [Dacryopinax primogenitus]|uniref:Replication factor A C-terminal domain-containing protein n=1 Tax=Dacryopinax primogenitus (strain DJM 731) TaxID=1858805 RepID=M5FWZ9_DACPD|nr:uncharacterized protein DACRYDRAFT_16343 [Dacryopinax primogenitus]EJU00949.1 hypothetical protein DACRYDRAFT_16343 [Dacryopinax primogenitus]
MPTIIPGWEAANAPYLGYLHSLDLVATPDKMAPANHLLMQAATQNQMGRTVFMIIGVGQVPPKLVALHAPIVAQPAPPIPTQIDQLHLISSPLDPPIMQHYTANPTLLPGPLPQPPVQPLAPPGLGMMPLFANINTIVAFMKGLNVCICITQVKPKEHGTIDILCHDATGEIDLDVCRACDLQASDIEEGKIYEIYNVGAMALVQHWCPSFHVTQLNFNNWNNDGLIPLYFFNYHPIIQLPSIPDKKIINVPCIIANTSNVMHGKAPRHASFGHASAAPMMRIDMWLVDDSGRSVCLVAFNEFWAELEGTDGCVALLKNIAVDCTYGMSLKTVASYTKVFFEPAIIPGYADLTAWWEAAKDNPSQWHLLSTSCSADGTIALAACSLMTAPPIVNIHQVHAECLDQAAKAMTFHIAGTLDINKQCSVTYAGCATLDCNRKVHQSFLDPNNLHYHCPTGKQSFSVPIAKYCLSFTIIDGNSDCAPATAFNTAATLLLQINMGTMYDVFADEHCYQPVHSFNLGQAMMTVHASTPSTGYWKGKTQWIVMEFFNMGHVYDLSQSLAQPVSLCSLTFTIVSSC